MELTTWVKPDNSEIKLNDAPATVKKARELGWKMKTGKKPAKDNGNSK